MLHTGEHEKLRQKGCSGSFGAVQNQKHQLAGDLPIKLSFLICLCRPLRHSARSIFEQEDEWVDIRTLFLPPPCWSIQWGKSSEQELRFQAAGSPNGRVWNRSPW